MRIRVMYDDGRLGMVKPQLLDKLLGEENVTSFMRSEGWVVVGRDTIRSHRRSLGYDGAERRTFYVLNVPLERKLVMGALMEIAWIAGPLVLISIMLSGLL